MKKIWIPALFWLLVWQGVALAVGTPLLLPGPGTVALRLWAMGGTADFWASAGASLLRVFGGFLAGAAAAVLIAGLTSAWPWAHRLLAPGVRVIRATPVASFIILVLLWARRDMVPVIVSALMVLPVVWENVSRGVAQTDPLLLELAKSYGFGRWRTLRLIVIPSALPYLVSGCRTAVGLAWKAGVAAEVLCLPQRAAGTELYRAKLYLETPDLFAWTVAVVALSLCVEWLVGRALDGRRGERT